MFTVCPKCSLKLSVTAADLRVAQGFVRCGRCTSVFNALAGLTDEQQSALAEELRPLERTSQAASERTDAPATAAPKAPAERPAPRPSVASDEPISDSALEFDHTSTDVSQVFIEPPPAAGGATGTFESIVLESDEGPLDDQIRGGGPAHIDFELDDIAASPETTDTAPRPTAAGIAAPAGAKQKDRPEQAVAMPAASAAKTRGAPAAPASADQAAPRTGGAPGAIGSAGGERKDATVSLAASSPAPPVSVRPALSQGHELILAEPTDRADRLLQVGSVLALLVLAAQIVHHYRVELADYAGLRGPLTTIYAALGVPLEPHWDVSAYEVHQLGAFAGAQTPGELTVRASVKNTAPRVQPLPLLRIIVQDRFGNRIAARDVTPSAYLPRAASTGSLGAGQRIDAEIAFVDPGPNAVGFEVDACLEQSAGRIRCANDPNATH
jgi:predicted Zn finger-like uncharacterized protein